MKWVIATLLPIARDEKHKFDEVVRFFELPSTKAKGEMQLTISEAIVSPS